MYGLKFVFIKIIHLIHGLRRLITYYSRFLFLMEFDFGFPEGLFKQYFTKDFVGMESLLPEEALLPGTWAQKRIRHFSTGRFCARKALSKLGLKPQSILIGEKKEPLWPSATIGSISHCSNLVGAVAAHSYALRGIGLDIETMGKIEPAMYDVIFTQAEQQFLRSQQSEDLPFFTTAIFGVKEAYYKLQYPLTRLFLDYGDVEVSYDAGEFRLRVIAEVPDGQPQEEMIRYVRFGEEVIVVAVC